MTKEKPKVVVFSGGRGAASIIRELVRDRNLDVIVVVNAYDDGLSTGVVRERVDGLLGPSDVRKNFSNLLQTQGEEGERLARLLEYRIGSIPAEVNTDEKIAVSRLFEFIDNQREQLNKRAGDDVKRWVETFFVKQLDDNSIHDFSWLNDMSLGNLIFAGCFLENNSDFNRSIDNWTTSFDLHCGKILNVTMGENLYLVATKDDGTYLSSEVSIVEPQSSSRITQIYLLSPEEAKKHASLADSGTVVSQEELRTERILPKANPSVLEEIEEADLIVYGPGTQHSSLLPSYLTLGVSDAIAKSNVEKVFISNLSADYDIQSENLNSLVNKLTEYMNMGATTPWSPDRYITQCFLSTTKRNIVPWGISRFDDSHESIGTHVGQWTIDGLKHDGKRVANGLRFLINRDTLLNTATDYTTLTIVIPVLNEIERIPIVLERLLTFDWIGQGLIPEFIVVDGGSTDGSVELVTEFPSVKCIQLPSGTGRGYALKSGIDASSSELVVIFPADNEYEPEAIIHVTELLRTGLSPIAFGSRVGLCIDTDQRLREIYGGRTKIYYLSKWGGFVLSLLSGIIYKRWLSDTLTSVKGFKREAFQTLSLEGKSADWDAKLIVDAAKGSLAIAEVPVEYKPRRLSEGKKIRTRDGLRAVLTLVKGSFL